MQPPAVARLDRPPVEGFGDRGGGAVENAAGRKPQRHPPRGEVPACPFDVIEHGEVRFRRGRGVIGDECAEERPGGVSAGRKTRGPGLKRGAGGLVLESARGEAFAEREGESAGVAASRAQDFEIVGRKACCAIEAAMRRPGIGAALGEILPGHQDIAGARMAGDEMIEVLARVGLVAHQKIPLPQAEILNKDGVALRLVAAAVDDLDPPQPGIRIRVQPEADAE